MPDVVLKVAGQRLTGWESLELTRSLEAVSGSFEASVSNRDPFPIEEGAEVEVWLEGFQVLTGHLDLLRRSFTARERTLTLAGRDRTADLVDCVAVDAPAEFEGLGLDGIAIELAKAFEIPVHTLADVGKEFERFALQPGETAFVALERAARLRGVLLTTDGLGGLLLETPSSARAAVELVEGRRGPGGLLAGRGSFDRSDRFHRYVTRGNLVGSDLLYAEECETGGEAFDDAIRKTRSTLILCDGEADDQTAQALAEWNATVRRARGSALQVVVQGWRQLPLGDLWRPNLVVHTRSATLRVARDLLISQVRFRLDVQNGTTTELELVGVNAYQRKPVLDPDGLDIEGEIPEGDE